MKENLFVPSPSIATAGAIIQNIEVFRVKSQGGINPKNSQASPTPVLEGDRVYLHFGAWGTACITEAGEIVWKTRLEYDNGQHGPGGSPVIYDNLLIVSCDGQDIQYVVALDKMTGKVKWKKTRQGFQAYTTPLIIRLAGETRSSVREPSAPSRMIRARVRNYGRSGTVKDSPMYLDRYLAAAWSIFAPGFRSRHCLLFV